jgi:hypothetical protein
LEIKNISFKYTKCFLVVLLLIVFPTGSYAFQYKNLDLKITGTIAEMYDDNLTFTNTKEDKREDYITTLGLGLSTKYEGKRRSLDLSGRVNYRFNAKYEDIKNNSENATINFQNAFSEYQSIGLRYVFSHSHTPDTFEEELDRVSGRRESFKHNFSSNYLMSISERFGINLMYLHSLKQFSEEDRDDTSNSSVGFNTTYLVGSATSLSLSYNFGRNNFDSEIYNVSLGVKYDITERSYFYGRLGWDSSFYADQSNENVNADISYNSQIDQNTFTVFSYRRGERFNSEQGNISSVWQVQGDVSRQLLERLSAFLSCYYGEDTSEQTFNFFNFSYLTEITNSLVGANLSLSYELWEDALASVSYSFSDLDSTDESIGYTRNSVTLSLSKSF